METVGVSAKDESGTTISFLPDSEVFEETEFDAATLLQRLRETAFLTRGLRIVLRDERAGGRTDEFHYEGGIKDFVAHVNEAKDPVHKHIVYFEGESDEGAVEVAMQWNSSYVESVFSFANNINTTEGGRTCRASGRADAHAQPVRAPGGPPEGEGRQPRGRGREGLAAVISVKLRNPQFEGQTKTKLGNPGSPGSSRRSSTSGWPSSSRRTRPRLARSSRRRSPRATRGRPRARRASSRAARARSRTRRFRKARRLHDQGPRVGGALHRRGRLGRRLGEAGPRPHDAGDPAAAREDHQLREEPHQQGAVEHGDPGDDHRDRHRLR